ncbi:MAG: hypothetical protein ACI4TM_01670 [Candidatus Cryptobacteroides sp.]
MQNKKPIIPAKDANESQKAYRERIAKERAEEQQRQEFQKFVTDKREDYAMTALDALLKNPNTDVSAVEANVEVSFKYADTMLYKLHNIRFVRPANESETTPAPEEDRNAKAATKKRNSSKPASKE